MIYWVMAKKSLLVIHKTEIVNIILIVYQIIFLLFVFLLSKVWGVIGILFATSVTSFIFVFVFSFYQKKYFNFAMNINDFKKLLTVIFIIMGGVVPSILFRKYFIKIHFLGDFNGMMQQIVTLATSSLIYFTCLITLYKFIRVKELEYAVFRIQSFILTKFKI